MKITVNPYTLPVPKGSFSYLVRVEKNPQQWAEYVVDIESLPTAFCGIFDADYDPAVVRSDFYMVNFYPQESLFTGASPYGAFRKMKFSWHELKDFMTRGVGLAILDFKNKHAPHAIVAIPAREGLKRLYDEVLDENEQKIGYNYVRRYVDWGIYVIET